MKKAFTMIELVFVIVIVGIISAMIAPNFQGNSLREAADQVISHIRYTQHLAMMDDKFVPNKSMSKYSSAVKKTKETKYYYKGRWQISFFNVAGETPSSSFTAYTIFSDSPSSGTSTTGPLPSIEQYDGNPNQSTSFSEVAVNPENPNKYLIGAKHSSFTIGNEHITKSMNLNKKYGIELVQFRGGCASAHRVAFDYLGRPIGGDLKTSNFSYEVGRLFNTDCNITLSASDKNITITIKPETGYAYISKS